MRILVLYAHPVETSFVSGLHRQVLDVLRARGHEVDDCDLYAEAFDPVLSRDERLNYHDTEINREHVSAYADRLLAASALILVYPVWNEGFPAILKGFLDRVFLPGVVFEMKDGASRPALRNVTRLAAVCTYGADRLTTMLVGDPPRRVVKRLLRSMAGHHVACNYLAHYDMNHSTAERRDRFAGKVRRAFEAWDA